MKIKLTKGELKRQRDALRRYERFLPTLQLKKQQLQIEVVRQAILLEEKELFLERKLKQASAWANLLSEPGVNFPEILKIKNIDTQNLNIAGVDIPVFLKANFLINDYDLFLLPVWVDAAVELFKEAFFLREEIAVIKKGVAILRHELKIATQRVNLFEKVKIPEANEAIRGIKIYIGDQMTNAVGRAKIAKNKIESLLCEEVAA